MNSCTGTSSKLHKFLLDATLGAPVAFFDVTPIGRILNRFSSDMVVVDEELSQTISQLTNSLFSCIGAVGAIAGATKGTFLALCVPLIFLYERIQRYFRKSNTAIARNQSVSLSPIYADFSQALTGKNEYHFVSLFEVYYGIQYTVTLLHIVNSYLSDMIKLSHYCCLPIYL